MEKPDKRRKYDAAFCTEALRVVAESRSTPAAARALNLDPKLLYNGSAMPCPLTRPRRWKCASCGPPTGGWRRSWRF